MRKIIGVILILSLLLFSVVDMSWWSANLKLDKWRRKTKTGQKILQRPVINSFDVINAPFNVVSLEFSIKKIKINLK